MPSIISFFAAYPDRYQINYARRSLLKMRADYTVEFV
jgi:hypothetical protein